MKNLLIFICIILTFGCCNIEQQDEFEEFLLDQKLTAKEYILEQFETHDIVILCERIHDEFTQYELIFDIVSDSSFIENVGVVFTEIGTSNHTNEINVYLNSETKDSSHLNEMLVSIIRDYSWSPLWPQSNYPWFLSQCQKLNASLPKEKRIRVFPSDIAYNWDEISSEQQILDFDMLPRDSIMANNVIYRLDSLVRIGSSNGKALVIMNSRHAFLKDLKTQPYEGFRLTNTGRHLHDYYKEKVASIYLTSLVTPNDRNKLEFIHDGYWDYLFTSMNKTDIGFDIKGTPFGLAPAELSTITWKKDSFILQDLFSGMIYYNHYDSLYFVRGWEGLIDSSFAIEYRKRCKLYYGAFGDTIEEEEIQRRIEGKNKRVKAKFKHSEERLKPVNQWK